VPHQRASPQRHTRSLTPSFCKIWQTSTCCFLADTCGACEATHLVPRPDTPRPAHPHHAVRIVPCSIGWPPHDGRALDVTSKTIQLQHITGSFRTAGHAAAEVQHLTGSWKHEQAHSRPKQGSVTSTPTDSPALATPKVTDHLQHCAGMSVPCCMVLVAWFEKARPRSLCKLHTLLLAQLQAMGSTSRQLQTHAHTHSKEESDKAMTRAQPCPPFSKLRTAAATHAKQTRRLSNGNNDGRSPWQHQPSVQQLCSAAAATPAAQMHTAVGGTGNPTPRQRRHKYHQAHQIE
jgi:hypothetical protein